MLDDLLSVGLKVVFCGTAAGDVSALRRQYYAGPGNKFWPILFKVGLTPRCLAPSEYRDLLDYGIGLTDVVKGQSGGDADIDFRCSDPDILREKMRIYSPSVLAFNGKKAGAVFLGRTKVEYGLQAECVGTTRLFIAPSTSGAANGHWNEQMWRELAGLVREVAT